MEGKEETAICGKDKKLWEGLSDQEILSALKESYESKFCICFIYHNHA